MNSVWEQAAEPPRFTPLEQDIKTDVLVIGGGIAGILCAYQLQQAGVRCVLVEAKRMCGGVTGKTTAKITIQHGLIYDKLIRMYGVTAAQRYYKANRASLAQYRALCQCVECDFEERDSYVYTRDNPQKLRAELQAMKKIGCQGEWTDKLPLPFGVVGAVRVERQAQFNPLKFLCALAKDLEIYENTAVRELRPGGARCDRGRIQAKKIIVATHFPFLNKHGSYFLKLYQSRSYVLGLKNAPLPDGMYVDENEKGLSFRTYGDLLLLGGGSHRTGKQGGGWRELEDFAKRYYPKATVAYRWATQDCMSLDGVPYIGPYSAHTPDFYVAAGFNKWGMTGAMTAAMLLADQVLGKKSDYAAVFSPSRSILHPQLAVNAAEAALGLITPTVPRCPHLGCALKYNRAERSWDCPCHGSRFTADGALIDNPATGDIQ